jgi:membrane associated rhomboid family serine protease
MIRPIQVRNFPVATLALVAANVAAFACLLVMAHHGTVGKAFHMAMVPSQLVGALHSGSVVQIGTVLYSCIASAFLHSSLVGILGNMVVLFAAGEVVERLFGKTLFLTVYVLGSIAGVVAQVLSNPGSVIPVIGAGAGCAAVFSVYAAAVFAGPLERSRSWKIFVAAMALLLVGEMIVGALGFWPEAFEHTAYWGMLGGYATGYVISFFLRPEMTNPPAEEALV